MKNKGPEDYQINIELSENLDFYENELDAEEEPELGICY